MDDALLKVIAQIPQQSQRQFGTDEQLRLLKIAANRLGLYDAADRIARMEEPSTFMQRVNLTMSRKHRL